MSRKNLVLGLAAFFIATVAGLPALAAPNTHQWVRVKNATAAPIKLTYLSPTSVQLVEELAPGDYTDADVKRGKDNNVVVQLVAAGEVNQANTKLTKPPVNYDSMQIRVVNQTAVNANISFYSPGGQQWSTLGPASFLDVTLARGPAGYLLLQFVP